MDYARLYDRIIQHARADNRCKGGSVYYESHHIIPRCMEGADGTDNRVLLTAREHFLAHWILVKMYPADIRLVYAFNRFCCDCWGHRLGARSHLYKYARERYIQVLKTNEAWKRKMGASMEKLLWIKHTDTGDCLRVHKGALSVFHKLGYTQGRIIGHRKPHTRITRDNIARAHKNKHLSAKHKEAIGAKFSGRIWLNDGDKSLFLHKDAVPAYLSTGWKPGRSKFKGKTTYGK
jgi:hypothetical protein